MRTDARTTQPSEMHPTQWDKVKALFHAAVEQPAEQRSAILDVAVRDDAGLRASVDALLDSYAATDDFMEMPAAALYAGGRTRSRGPCARPSRRRRATQ